MPDGVRPGAVPVLPLSRPALAAWFADRLGTCSARLTGACLLPGGAIQHNWRVDVETDAASHAFVLRAGPEVTLPESRSKPDEFAFLRCAQDAGVPVPEPLWLCDGETPFFVTGFLSGDARREALVARADNSALVRDLGTALAQIHAVLPVDGVVAETPAVRVATLERWIGVLDRLERGIRAELAAGIGWLQAHAPDRTPVTLVHRDFRTGNFLVENGRLVVVLDWEFAGRGDPAEDIGWFCAACWRGAAPDRAAGGLGAREDFYGAYTAAGGVVLDAGRVFFWEVFAHLRWAVIALQQGARARAGAHPAWELEEAEARLPGLLRTVGEMVRRGG
ncbi:MAG: phosphotransferase family protein [Alphaproteobacteria bacterium]